MKKILLPLLGMLILLCIWHVFHRPSQDRTVTSVLTILRGAPVLFLATERLDHLLASRVHEGHWLTGFREGVATIPLHVYVGTDLGKLDHGQVRIQGTRVRVRIPEPEVLAIESDWNHLECFTRASGLHHVWDSVQGRSLREDLLRQVSVDVATYRASVRPLARDSVVDRLNRASTNLFKPHGLEVMFE